MRKFLAVFMLASATALAQNTPSETEHLYRDSSESVQMLYYLKAGKDLFFSDRTKSQALTQRAYDIAVSKPEFENTLADIYNFQGLLMMYNEHFSEAEALLEKSLKMAEDNNLNAIRLKALGNLALNSMKKGDYQQSIIKNLEIIPLLEKDGNKGALANAYSNLSNCYSYLHQIQKSNDYQYHALRLFEETDNRRGMANAWNTLGSNYTDLHDFTNAIFFLKKSLIAKDFKDDDGSYGNTCISIANLFYQQHSYQQMLPFLKKGETYFLQHKNNTGLVKLYSVYANYYYGLSNYKEASRYESLAEKLSANSNDVYVKAVLYENMASNAAELNEMKAAYDLTRKALQNRGDLVDTTLQRQIADIEIKYKTLKQEETLKYERYNSQRKNYLIVGILSLLLLGIALGISVNRRKQLQQEAKMQAEILHQQVKASAAILQAEADERQRIAKDLHDGVGQLMSAARMNLSVYKQGLKSQSAEDKLRFDNVFSLIDESCKEVRTVSHNMMPNALIKNNLKEAISEFIFLLDQRKLKVNLYTEGLDNRLSPDVEMVLYRVLQECVNNVIKHANATELDISVIRDAQDLTATIEDNGIGFNTAQDLAAEGIGMKNIRARVTYLKGTVEFISNTGRGTCVMVYVPV